jgi:CRISPR-associated protein Csb2
VFALGIRYLNGFVAASEPDARDHPEWPPHPARVFMALAAAHFQAGGDPAERAGLEWLESLGPPALQVPVAAPRKAVIHYVPVNDKAGDRTRPPTATLQSVPQLMRDRHERTFARAWLDHEIAYLLWPEAVSDARVARALDALCAKVTRIGHSTSLVHMWVADAVEAGPSTWAPDDERAEIQLRVPGPGMLADLERRYNGYAVDAYTSLVVVAEEAADARVRRATRKRLKEEFGDGPPARLRPHAALYHGYARPQRASQDREISGTLFSPHLVVFTLERHSGPYHTLDLSCSVAVAERWREALVSRSNDVPQGIREVVSGHDRAGSPLARPHLAVVPLAFVSHPHADGHLVGAAIALPQHLAAEERRQVLRVLGRVEELRLGPLGVWRLGRGTTERPAWNLRPEVWTAYPKGATHWATVTPVAFDRHPKAKDRGEAQRETAGMIAAACTAVGLPRPREVVVTPVSAHLGVPPAHLFPRLRRKDGSDRRHAHAILVFAHPVRGPVVIGAGRYRGYGVCRPLGDGRTL